MTTPTPTLLEAADMLAILGAPANDFAAGTYDGKGLSSESSAHMELWGRRALAAGWLIENVQAFGIAAAIASLQSEIEGLRGALERLDHNFDLLLAGKPVRDVAETKAEARAALTKDTNHD